MRNSLHDKQTYTTLALSLLHHQNVDDAPAVIDPNPQSQTFIEYRNMWQKSCLLMP